MLIEIMRTSVVSCDSLTQDSVLTLVRESEYDDKAVAIMCGLVKLGHVPRNNNVIVANLMDCGVPMCAAVSVIHNKFNVDVIIYMDVELKSEKYFVSYMVGNIQGINGIANIITTNYAMDTESGLKQLQSDLEERFGKGFVAIINFRRLNQ